VAIGDENNNTTQTKIDAHTDTPTTT
jgi:hypothetical protein